MSKQQFFEQFDKQNIEQALTTLKALGENEQLNVLKQLHYQAREAKMPVSLGVLYRELHDGKEFQDFYDAWMPPAGETDPFTVSNTTYHNYFKCPTRVINAINLENPKEIISIGMMWCSKQEFEQGFKEMTASKSNSQRADNISNVAKKISAKIYMVEADTGLGD